MRALSKQLGLALCLLAFAAPGGQAVSTVSLGQTGLNNDTSTFGPDCNAFGYSDAGSPSYSIPFDGVFSSFFVRQGNTPTDTTHVRLRTYRVTVPVSGTQGHAVPETEGASWPMSLADTPTSAVGAFVDRIPATAGDRLGIEITTGPYLGNAQCRAANTGSTSDRTATSFAAAPLGADHVFDADPAYTKFLPNILANYEHDTDGDKYGDATQDLCVGDPAHSTTACSGTLMGSQLSGARPHPYNCVTTCTLFQQTSNGAQTTAPYNGVIVRWRLQPFAGVTAKLRVMHKTDNYYATMDGTGDPATVSTTTPGEITTIPSRLAVKQGDWVAIELQGPANMGFIQDPNSGWSAVGSGIPDGGQNIWGGSTPIPGSLPFDYDLEPDADLDGYGDITQDQCSTDPAEQGACPRPVISGLKFSPSKFSVSKKAKAIAAKTKSGSKFSLSLSKVSRVSFAVKIKTSGRKVGSKCVKQTSKNRAKKKCTYLRTVANFARSLPLGPTTLAFTGKIKNGKKTVTLAPGSYTVVATPVSTLSLVAGLPLSGTFRILVAA